MAFVFPDTDRVVKRDTLCGGCSLPPDGILQAVMAGVSNTDALRPAYFLGLEGHMNALIRLTIDGHRAAWGMGVRLEYR